MARAERGTEATSAIGQTPVDYLNRIRSDARPPAAPVAPYAGNGDCDAAAPVHLNDAPPILASRQRLLSAECHRPRKTLSGGHGQQN